MSQRPSLIVVDAHKITAVYRPDLVLSCRRARSFVAHHGWEEFLGALEAKLSTLVKGSYELRGLSSTQWMKANDETSFVTEGIPRNFLVGLADIGQVLQKRPRPKHKDGAVVPRGGRGIQLCLLDDGKDDPSRLGRQP
jgi:hypothetical protein